jgi:hypothetical protein
VGNPIIIPFESSNSFLLYLSLRKSDKDVRDLAPLFESYIRQWMYLPVAESPASTGIQGLCLRFFQLTQWLMRSVFFASLGRIETATVATLLVCLNV